MKLKEYLNAFPRSERPRLIECMAHEHGVSLHTLRSWIQGTRRHPCARKAIERTEKLTAGKVTRHDLRPEVYGPIRPP